ncbi:MAG: cupin domain-containing protein [Bacilli bacterium]|jgi:quercetin dioxygenase-like cupin family protein|nr:cupin domain-containing protein [Bacilli bacterium]MCH4210272.1 cupin domain-containing protein [Bacilli bacterium]MCH4228196.1 cupin domain-containing protein [Bacilli bacterium]MCH4277450.1 cupin domain-containing protein [Bacilli bacterium]MCI2054648.1 cupin domain-containing protein [Bacilli bacterium]
MNLSEQKEIKIDHLKGGEGSVYAKMQDDGKVKIMLARLPKGSSIGLHTHVDSSEIIYAIKGRADFILNGEKGHFKAGEVHYCPKGGSHTMWNPYEEDLEVLCVVPKQ